MLEELIESNSSVLGYFFMSLMYMIWSTALFMATLGLFYHHIHAKKNKLQ